MLPEALDARLRAMPKAEIHVHLEGAQSPETVWRMAERNGVALPASSPAEWESFYRFRDFEHFIMVYGVCCYCAQTAQDLAEMAEALHARQAAENVVYTEAFLSASLFVDRLPQRELLAALAAGCEAGRARHGVTVRFIPDITRHRPDTQERVLELAIAGFEAGLFIGLGLGGVEAGHPPAPFAETFARARSAGLRVVAHAGEGAGAESVRGAVEHLGAERIGHGIRCLEDPETVALLRARRIPLEVCPTSNYRTGVVAATARHPIHDMLAEGLVVTVNSDDPPMFATSLTDEYRYLAGAGLDWDALWRLNRNTLEATFLDEAGKQALRARWAAFEAALEPAGRGV